MNALRRQLTLFVVAAQFLTRLPLPAPPDFHDAMLARSTRYFPLVGVLIGALNVGVWWLARRAFPDAVAVGLSMAASLLVTGAFHEDGFADTCDGFGGGTTAQRVLAIMKDSRIGAYGALGVVMLLGLKWTTLAALPVAAFPLLVVAAHMTSRWCAIGLIWRLRYVRNGADAKAKPVSDSLSGPDWLLSGALGTLAVLPFIRMADVRVLLAALAAAALTALIAAAYARQRIGGYTGDYLGAVQQLAELAFTLSGLALLAPPAAMP